MRRIAALLLFVFAGIGAFLIGDGGRSLVATLPNIDARESDQGLLEWLAALPVPRASRPAWVRVEYGPAWEREPGEEFRTSGSGVVLSENERLLRVVVSGIQVIHVWKGADIEPAPDVRRASFDEGFRAQLAKLEVPEDEESWTEVFDGVAGNLTDHAEALLLAALADRVGRRDLAMHALQVARRTPVYGTDEPPDSLADVAREDLALPIVWQLTLDCADPLVSRTELAERWRAFCAMFPASEHTRQANEFAELYTQMAREDAAHDASIEAWDAMTPDEQIDELVWQLRNVPGGQFMQPGAPIFFDHDHDRNPTALRRLVERGPAAIPALIEALDDPRPGRSVGFWRDFTYSHYVQRVGEAALQALAEIAGASFVLDRRSLPSRKEWPRRSRVVQAEARAWWTSYQGQGERALLIERLETGKGGSTALRRLTEIDADAARAIAVQALRSAPRSLDRKNLITGGALHPLADAPLLDAVIDVFDGDGDPVTAIAAARFALQHERREVLPGLIEMWRDVRDAGYRRDESREELISALAQLGGREGLAALAERPDEHVSDVAGRLARSVGLALPRLDADARQPAIAFLVHLLADARRTGGWHDDDGRRVPQRVRDDAARHLARHWKLPFRRAAGERARAEHVRALAREAERRTGLAPGPEPDLIEVPKLSEPASSRVRRVVVTAGSAPPGPDTERMLQALVGARLSGAALRDVVRSAITPDAERILQVDLLATVLEGTETGFEIEFSITRGRFGGRRTWRTITELEGALSVGPHTSIEDGKDPPTVEAFAWGSDRIDEAMASGPAAPLTIAISVRRD